MSARRRRIGAESSACKRWFRMPHGIFNHVPRIGSKGLLVYIALADHMNEEGECWPHIARLMKLTALSRRSVLRALHCLESAGLIEVFRSIGRGNRYRLPVPHRHGGSATEAPDQCHRGTPDKNKSQQRDSRTNARATDNQLNGNAFLEEQFRQLVAAYPPHKVIDENQARRAFLHLRPDPEMMVTMLHVLEEQKGSAQWQEQNGRYVPRLQIWLEEGRYKRMSRNQSSGHDRARQTKERMERKMRHD